MYAVAKKNILRKSQMKPPFQIQSTDQCTSALTQPCIGLPQPPRNRIGARNETRIMFAYSVRKNTANGAPEYSTWKPATISDSPSATSNGARFVSATPETKYTRNSGNSGKKKNSKKPSLPACALTIADRFMLPAATSTPTSAKPMAIS